MFAELRLVTDDRTAPQFVIPSAAVIEAEEKKLVYVQNGNSYQPITVTLGRTVGDLVEVKTGLFAGDLVVTQRAPQLYAQSLKAPAKDDKHAVDEGKAAGGMLIAGTKIPLNSLWFAVPGLLTIGASTWWLSKKIQRQQSDDRSPADVEIVVTHDPAAMLKTIVESEQIATDLPPAENNDPNLDESFPAIQPHR
jgi:membrane fusion protein, heavy metal efflux system